MNSLLIQLSISLQVVGGGYTKTCSFLPFCWISFKNVLTKRHYEIHREVKKNSFFFPFKKEYFGSNYI